MAVSIPDPLLFSATIVRKLIDCQTVDGYVSQLVPPWNEIAEAVNCCPPDPRQRTLAFEAKIAGLPDVDQVRAAVFAADIQAKLADLVKDDSQRPADIDLPHLPSGSLVPEDIGKGACPWLDEYIAFSRLWAPSAYDDFHEAIGVWILSTCAARRVLVHIGKHRFPNLYISLVARTSFFTKTTGADIGVQTLQFAGMGWLLADDSSTPQKFLSEQANHNIQNYDNMSEEMKEWARLHAWSAGQRGWYYEEFGDQIRNMLKDGGFMADFRGILRRWDDTPESYSNSTIGRGTDKISRPYLALLANMTPADLRPYARRGSSLWGDGFLARYALITPPENARGSGRFPLGERIVPVNIIKLLQLWNQKLGIPGINVIDVPGKDNKSSATKQVVFTPLKPIVLECADDVLDAFYSYHEGLLYSRQGSENADLDGNYARMAEKAIRVAMLLASISGSDRILMNHWARAQAITERWRGGLHQLYSQVNESAVSPERDKEDNVLRQLNKLGPSTAAEICRYIRNLSTIEAARILDGLVSLGVLKVSENTQKGTKRYEIA